MSVNRYRTVRIYREFTNLGKLQKQREKENNKRNKKRNKKPLSVR